MLRTTTLVLAFVLGAIVFGAAPPFYPGGFPATASARANDPGQQSPLKPTAADISFHDDETQAELQLLVLANQARAQAGVGALTLDSGLSHAALAHAQVMLQARQLSHQFSGEPSLAQRLAAATKLQLDLEGENVALDDNAEQAHQHLMLSPPHRANLLNPEYNVIGLGVIRSGDYIYVVQDFGHALPNYSMNEVKDRVAAAVVQVRHQAGQPNLIRQDIPNADDAACSMAQADKLGTLPVHQLSQRYTVLSYTQLHPETLPTGADHAIARPNLRSYSVGTCYSKTDTYPTGVYWIVLSLD